MNKRELLKCGCGALAVLSSGLRSVHAMAPVAPRANHSDRPYLSAALQSAAWLRSVRQETHHGVTWPFDPLKPDIDPTLYTGAPGILPFLLELHHATGDDTFLEEAILGADQLIATELTDEQLRDPKVGLGFYVGMAGLAYVIERVHQASRQAKYRQHAQRIVDVLHERTNGGTRWPADNDVVSGVAGTGLFLIWWSRIAHDKKALSLAHAAGRALVSRGQSAPGGVSWKGISESERYYPNFSHGTSGIAYFLATLSSASGEKEFLQAALQGARHLQAITTCNEDGCLLYRHEPEAKQLYYFGWCHGPAGTSRLYRVLAHLTRDGSWRDAVFRGADAVLHSGIPEHRSDGFWNNVSACCGNASVAAYMLSLYREYGDTRYLDFARRMTDDLLHRATLDEHGMRWVQAENRVSPNEVIAQTGYMQGAAGIGTWLLRLDGQFKRRAPGGLFPDDISI